jgi:hypothetical protein
MTITLRLTIPLMTSTALLVAGCTFEARGEARAEGSTSSGSAEPAPEARRTPPPRRARRAPPPRGRVAEAPPPEAEVTPPPEPEPEPEVEPEPEPDRGKARKKRSRRARHKARPAPKGPERHTCFGSTKPKKKALQGNIYFLEKNTRRLPDFEEMEPVGTIYANKLDVPARRFDEGFPGITERDEWFAIVYTGTFKVNRPGTYKFRLHTDDGSKLYINDELVIDNDGAHPPRSKEGSIRLSRGTHEIVVEYFQGPRYHIALQLFWTPPGGEEQIMEFK